MNMISDGNLPNAMADDTHLNLPSIREQIARLEEFHKKKIARQNLIIFLLTCLSCVGAGHIAMWVARSLWPSNRSFIAAKTVETEQLQVRERDNELGCILGFDRQTHDLLLDFKKKDRNLLRLGISQLGESYIVFMDGNEQTRIDIGVHPSGNEDGADTMSQNIIFNGSTGKRGLELGVSSSNIPSLKLADRNGRPVMSLFRSPDDLGLMSFFDRDGRRVINLGPIERSATLRILDSRGQIHEFPGKQSQ